MGKKALLVIDMLKDFVDEGGVLYCGPQVKDVIDACRREIDEARKNGYPVIYICDTHHPDDREFTMFPRHCVAGTPGAEVTEALRPREGDKVIPKRRYSGFYGTDLDLTLREAGVTEILVTGVCTNICVFFTTADARMRAYEVAVVEDAVTSFDLEAHRMFLRQMESVLGAKIVRRS